jgi:hypothetical protein
MTNEKKYWFPAKRYGWGWGLPNVWQGWVVLAVFIALMIGGHAYLRHSVLALPYTVFLVVLLIATCWLKGEPPRWRSGSD